MHQVEYFQVLNRSKLDSFDEYVQEPIIFHKHKIVLIFHPVSSQFLISYTCQIYVVE